MIFYLQLTSCDTTPETLKRHGASGCVPWTFSCKPCNISSIRFGMYAALGPKRTTLDRPCYCIHFANKVGLHSSVVLFRPSRCGDFSKTEFGTPGADVNHELTTSMRSRDFTTLQSLAKYLVTTFLASGITSDTSESLGSNVTGCALRRRTSCRYSFRSQMSMSFFWFDVHCKIGAATHWSAGSNLPRSTS